MATIPSEMKSTLAKAQLERMMKTLSWNLHCERCHRHTRHWYRGPATENRIKIFCAQCDYERSLRLTEIGEQLL